MSTSQYPNRDTLRKAQDIYLDAICTFVFSCLDKIPGNTADDLIRDSLPNNLHSELKDAID